MGPLSRPRLAGAGAVLLTTSVGVALLAALGAPQRLLLMNLGAGIVGAILLPGLAAIAARAPAAGLAALAAAAIWTTALWGADLEGIRRWARVGPVLFHVGFLVLPLVVVALPRAPLAGLLALAVAAAGIAAQPDLGSALALAAAACVNAAVSRTRLSLAAAAIAVAGLVATWMRPDPLGPVEFVERVVPQAFGASPILGVLALAALAAPAALLALAARRDRDLAPAAGFWLGAAVASLVGDYPTPILGAGVSPILGYALTWALAAGLRPRDGAG